MKNILEFLEKTAPVCGDRTAFSDGEESLSFSELLHYSRSGGSALISRGLKREPIAVFMSKSPRTIAAFFSVIYAGCYYVPLNASMPLFRLQMILNRIQPRAVICDEASRELAESLAPAGSLINASELFDAKEDEAVLSAVRAQSIDTDPAYIVFTSGSTGVPKGVTGNHRALIDYANALCPIIGADENSVFAMQVPLYVDACLKEILSVIKCGSSAYLMPQSLFVSPIKAVEFLNRYHVNTLCWVASALTIISGLGAFEEIKPQQLRTVCFGSEVFPVKQLKLWQDACPNAKFINLYGPTEATGMSFYYIVDRKLADTEPIPIGRPFDNTGFVLLRDDDKEAACGETGEICIRGTALTHGYFDDFERTSQSFTQNPLNTHYPELIYRTGDLGRLNERGELVFASRKDYQIKNMGHRIELGEIEACAECCDGVVRSCCLFDKEKGKIRMFYMGKPDEKALKKHLREMLPRYMQPNKIKRLDSLPLLENGKIDRNSLKDTEI